MNKTNMNEKSTLNKADVCVYFEHQQNEIIFKFSTWSGKEEVFVNNELVSSARNWRTQSHHTFSINGTHYKLSLSLNGFKNLLIGRTEIVLMANGQVVDQDTYCFTTSAKNNPKKAAWVLIPSFILGGIAGFFVSMYLLSLL